MNWSKGDTLYIRENTPEDDRQWFNEIPGKVTLSGFVLPIGARVTLEQNYRGGHKKFGTVKFSHPELDGIRRIKVDCLRPASEPAPAPEKNP